MNLLDQFFAGRWLIVQLMAPGVQSIFNRVPIYPACSIFGICFGDEDVKTLMRESLWLPLAAVSTDQSGAKMARLGYRFITPHIDRDGTSGRVASIFLILYKVFVYF